MRLFRLRTLAEFEAFQERNMEALAEHQAFLKSLEQPTPRRFKVPGYSYTAEEEVNFDVAVNFQFPNNVTVWRETVSCPSTGFNNRMRATFHLFDIEMEPYSDQRIYISEQLTPIYRYFKEHFPATVGSEFLGDLVPLGAHDSRGLRNEDLRQLSFEDGAFDAIVSLDVFEHIPEYREAFSECARVLRPGGRMMWSVPFVSAFHENIIRAQIVEGVVQHLHPPEYHGDPLSDDGVLCFQHFCWEMLDEVKAAGFTDSYAAAYQSKQFGYLGSDQFMFFAKK